MFLVHAGFDFKAEKPFYEIEEMLWIREFENDINFTNGKKIIHGHTPYTFDEINTKIRNDENIIPLDNGCVFNDIEGYGSLFCLNIRSFELIYQKNIEN